MGIFNNVNNLQVVTDFEAQYGNQLCVDFPELTKDSINIYTDEQGKGWIKEWDDRKDSPYTSNHIVNEVMRCEEIYNKCGFTREEEFAILEKSKNSKNDDGKKNMYFLACLVKPSHHIKGVFFIEEDEIYFKVFLNQKTGNAMNDVEVAFKTTDDDYDHSRQTCFGSYFVCHPKDKDLYKLSINYNNIKFLFKRRYYYKNSAMEIFTSTNKTYYFNFKYEKDRETVVNEIVY